MNIRDARYSIWGASFFWDKRKHIPVQWVYNGYGVHNMSKVFVLLTWLARFRAKFGCFWTLIRATETHTHKYKVHANGFSSTKTQLRTLILVTGNFTPEPMRWLVRRNCRFALYNFAKFNNRKVTIIIMTTNDFYFWNMFILCIFMNSWWCTVVVMVMKWVT